MSGEQFEHCWHFPPSHGAYSTEHETVLPMVCCHCGCFARRIERRAVGIPDGHGAFYPVGAEIRAEVKIDGPDLCPRKGRDTDR